MSRFLKENVDGEVFSYRLNVHVEDILLLQAFIDSFDNLAFMRTVDKSVGLIEIFVPIMQAEVIEDIIKNFPLFNKN
jgi:hypothetical protein